MPSLPVLLTLAGVALAAVSFWIARVLAAARQPADATAPGASLSIPAAPGALAGALGKGRQLRSDHLRMTFRRNLRRLREYVRGPSQRYRIPWFLLLGEPATGKSTLLRTLPLPRPIPRDEEDAAGCTWSYFDQAVVIEVGGEVYRLAGLGKTSAWHRFLRLLRWHRGERPLDGVVLTVSAEELLATGPGAAERVTEIGRSAFDRLADLQRILGVKFPVYLVVTKVDRIRGFTAFARALPPDEGREMLGWSNPYSLDRSFSADWVDEAFADLQQQLFRREVEVLATPGMVEDGDDLFAFASEFKRLRDPVRLFARELLRQNVYNDGWFFRGFYFTGDGSAGSAPSARPAAAPAASAEGAPVGVAAAPVPAEVPFTEPEPVFTGDLFRHKVFAESGLVRPVRRTIFSRHRSILACQAAIVALMLAVPGLGLASLRLERASQPLLSVLMQVEASQRAMRAAGSTTMEPVRPTAALEAQVLALLGSMADIEIGRFATPLIPTSYFSRLHSDISLSMSAAFSNVILPAMRGAVLARADAVFERDDVPMQPLNGTLVSRLVSPNDRVTSYLREVRDLGHGVDQYNTVAFIGADDELAQMVDLVHYLYERELPPYFLDRDRYYRDALWESVAPPITDQFRERETMRALTRAERIIEGAYDELIEHLEYIGVSLEVARQTQITGPDLDRFRSLPGRIRQVNAYLADSSIPWLDQDAPLGPGIAALLDSVPENPLFAREAFARDLASVFQAVRAERLLELQGRSGGGATGGSLIAFDADAGQMVVTPELVALSRQLDRLLAQPFVRGVPGTSRSGMSAAAGGRIGWDVPTLDRALAAHEAFEAFFSAPLDGVSPDHEHLLYLVGALYLEGALRETVASAVRSEAAPAMAGRTDAERVLAARITSLEPAVERLHRLLQVFQGLGLQAAHAEVATLLALQTSDLFQELDRLHSTTRPYLPADGTFGSWSGDRGAFLALYGAASEEQLDAYLARQRERMSLLATRYARPLIRWLEAEPTYGYAFSTGADVFPQGAFSRWVRLLEEIERFEAGTPGGSLATLETFLRTESAAIRPPECGGSGSAPAGDFFLSVRNDLRTALEVQCRSLTLTQARSLYETLERLFDGRVAGRFPFAGARTPEAAADDLRDLFAAAALITPGHRAALGTFVGGPQAAGFLARIDSIGAAFAPLLRDTPTGEVAPLRVRISFRARRDQELGGEHVVEWRARVGRQSWSQFDPAPAVEWRPGDPVELSFRWANSAPQRPLPATADRSHRVAFAGRWALPGLLAEYGIQASRGEHQLRFDIPLEATDAVAAAGLAPEATLWITVTVDDPATGQTVTVPAFPRVAPRLSMIEAGERGQGQAARAPVAPGSLGVVSTNVR